MATQPQTAATQPASASASASDPNGEMVATTRRRRNTGPRAASRPTPVYFVFQVMGEDGAAQAFPKARIKVLACERNTDKVLDIIDGDEHPNAIYVRGMLAPARTTAGAKAE